MVSMKIPGVWTSFDRHTIFDARRICTTCQRLASPRAGGAGEPSRSREVAGPSVSKEQRNQSVARSSSRGTPSLRRKVGVTFHPKGGDRDPPIVRAGKRAFLQDRKVVASSVTSSGGTSQEQAPTSFEAVSKDALLPFPEITTSTPNHQSQPDRPSAKSLSAAASKTKFIGFDLQTALPRIFLTKLPIYRSPLFTLRAYPSRLLPPRKAPPFPLHLSARQTYTGTCVYLAVLSSKAQVGKLAVERNRSRRRLKDVIDGVVNGTLGNVGRSNELVTPEHAYIASVTAAIHDAPFEQIVNEVVAGLRHLQRVQPSRQGVFGKLPEPRYLSNSSTIDGARHQRIHHVR